MHSLVLSRRAVVDAALARPYDIERTLQRAGGRIGVRATLTTAALFGGTCGLAGVREASNSSRGGPGASLALALPQAAAMGLAAMVALGLPPLLPSYVFGYVVGGVAGRQLLAMGFDGAAA